MLPNNVDVVARSIMGFEIGGEHMSSIVTSHLDWRLKVVSRYVQNVKILYTPFGGRGRGSYFKEAASQASYISENSTVCQTDRPHKSLISC